MVTRIGTKNRKTRHKNSAHYRAKGKIPLSKYFRELAVGDTVHLKTHPAVQIGRFFPRFHGFTGKVSGKRGACYAVAFKDGNKQKTIYVHPIHLV